MLPGRRNSNCQGPEADLLRHGWGWVTEGRPWRMSWERWAGQIIEGLADPSRSWDYILCVLSRGVAYLICL